MNRTTQLSGGVLKDIFNLVEVEEPILQVLFLMIMDLTVLQRGNGIDDIIGDPITLESLDGITGPKNSEPSSNLKNTSDTSTSNQTSVIAAPKASLQPGVHPISSLTPYQNKWTICARVTNKSNIREWANSRGHGQVFSMDLLDPSGEIRASVFNDQCEKIYNQVEPNKVYYISQGQLKTANKQYSSLKNDYEMTFSALTQITPCHENIDIPIMQFNFVSIGDLENVAKDSVVDVIGICKVCGDLATVLQRATQKELKKRDLQLLDESGKEVSLTLWGTRAENFNGDGQPIVAVKGVKVSLYSGRSLTMVSASSVTIDPDIKEAHKLRAWFENYGTNLQTVNLSNQKTGGSAMGANFKTFADVVSEKLGCNPEPDYYSTKAVPSLIRKENCMYKACPIEGCNKKVVDQNNGQYRCEKCAKEYDTYNWRLMLSANLVDGTDNVWVMMFQDQAEALLGHTSAKLGELRETNPEAFEELFQEATLKEFIFKLRVKMETYQEESRLKTTVVSVQPLRALEYNRKLIEEIKKLAPRF